MINLNIGIIFSLLFLTVSACTPQTELLFSSLRPGEIGAISNTALTGVASDYNVMQSIADEDGARITEVADQLGIANSLEAKATFDFPETEIDGISFTSGQNQAVYASGVLPTELYDQFSFITVMQLTSTTGQVFIYDTNDTNDLAAVTVSGTSLVLKHQTSTGNHRARSYNISAYLNQWHVYTFVFGYEGKDIQLYIDGYRQTTYTSDSTGGINHFSSVQRHLTIGGTSLSTFKLKHFSIVGAKVLPYQVFQVSKYLGKSHGISVSESVTKEIRNNTSPAVEPETIDYTFLASTILTNKCAGCHQPGGNTPYLNSYVNVMAGVNGDGDPVVTPGNITNSRLYQAVLDNSMPAGGATALTDTEKNYIKVWIEDGATN